MPLGVKPECLKCGALETTLWHATEIGNLCNNCLEDERTTNPSGNNDEDEKNCSTKPARKSTRITRYCSKPPKTNSALKIVPKGKGRRHIFKKHVS